jgi:DNA sulfur modification protein DndB
MFVDLNQHGVKPARSLRLFYDSRDESARVTRAVAENVALFRNLTDFSRSSLSSGSRKLFIFSNLHAANSTLVKDACLAVTPENPGLAVEFWQGVIENMPDWLAAGRREVAPAELRRDMVHAHGVALEAIALAGARMINEHPHHWKASLHGLREIDWTRSNAAAWEGRALSNGRITRTRTGVLLTAELISRALRSRLA